MTILSNRVEALAESETLFMARMAQELKDKGVKVVNMSLGEPDFFTPSNVKTAAKEAIDNNFSFYTPVPGYKDLLEVICLKLKRDNHLNYKPSQIVTSTGAKQSIANIVFSLVNPGDEVILPAPYWVSYAEMVNLAEGKVVSVHTSIESNFKMTPEQLDKAITAKTKLFIFSNPCNPTGTVYSTEELIKLKEVFIKHPHVYIIADEIYEHIVFSEKPKSMASFPELFDRVITVNGLSKGFAMTGWRFGYMAGPEAIAKACTKFQGQFTSGTSSITQRAAIEALKTDPVETKPMQEAFFKRRNLLIELMKSIPGIKINEPQGAFYLFPEVKHYFGKKNGDQVIKDAKDLALYLLEKAHVAVTPGAAFGAPNYVRLSYATSEENIRYAVEQLKIAFSELN